MTSQARLVKVGPANRLYLSTPQYFDLKGHKEISQIFISGANDGISSIQFQYVENGKYVLSDKYGCSQGNCNEFLTIELNHPTEYITGINGVYSGSDASKIKAITFTTNVKQYGPYGVPNSVLLRDISDPQVFTYNLGKSSCQFGGFHGTYDSFGLISIGFYLDAKTVPPKSTPKGEANFYM